MRDSPKKHEKNSNSSSHHISEDTAVVTRAGIMLQVIITSRTWAKRTSIINNVIKEVRIVEEAVIRATTGRAPSLMQIVYKTMFLYKCELYIFRSSKLMFTDVFFLIINYLLTLYIYIYLFFLAIETE